MDLVQVVSSSVLVHKPLVQKSIWAGLLTLQGLFGHSLCLPLQQLHQGQALPMVLLPLALPPRFSMRLGCDPQEKLSDFQYQNSPNNLQ